MDHRMTRRDSLKMAVVMAIAAIAPFEIRSAFAQTTKRIRYGAHTTDGARMLAIYADAVRAMADPTKYKEGDPRSWLFQWYTHSVRNDRTKASEIKRVYGSNPEALIAQAMWDTCEAHTDSDRQNCFLPWHRMYVLYFEEIVRQVTGKNEFTLPYWDYSSTANRALPAEFRKSGDAKWGSLYTPSRNKHANDGKPIDQPPGTFAINLDAMKSNVYDVKDGDAGFCANLDGGLHGAIHVDVGNGQGMGSVPWAARDPIFWLHHSNIDRVWASWAKAGGGFPSDSAFLGEMFNFADGAGKGVKAKVQDFMKLTQYEYDTYLDRPAGSLPFTTGPQLVAKGLRFDSVGKVNLGAKSTAVKLSPPTSSPGGGPLPVAAASVKDIPVEAAVHLRLEGLRAGGASSAVFDVHTSPPQQKQERTSPSFVGSVNFFGATHGHHSGGHVQGRGKVVSFLLSPQTRQLLASQSGPVQITLVPRGGANEGRPEIDRVSLVVG